MEAPSRLVFRVPKPTFRTSGEIPDVSLLAIGRDNTRIPYNGCQRQSYCGFAKQNKARLAVGRFDSLDFHTEAISMFPSPIALDRALRPNRARLPRTARARPSSPAAPDTQAILGPWLESSIFAHPIDLAVSPSVAYRRRGLNCLLEPIGPSGISPPVCGDLPVPQTFEFRLRDCDLGKAE
jgi:hypothetical protein